MKIIYDLDNESFTYEQKEGQEIAKLNFLLTNNKGDFLNLGAISNSCKFQGFNVCHQNSEIYKFLDEIVVCKMNTEEVVYGGYFARRDFISDLVTEVLEESKRENLEFRESAYDRFFLGPTGGIIYEIGNFNGDFYIDLDLRKLSDFDEWGRNYKVYKKDGVVLVEYIKKTLEKEDYKMYFGVKAVNFSYELLEEFVKKEYSYSRQRNSSYERYVFRLMKVNVTDNKQLICGAGFSEEEVLEQIFLLEFHKTELSSFDRNQYKDLISVDEFSKPLTQNVSLAYRLSSNAIYRFLNKNIGKPQMFEGLYAGYPWFSQVWARDELVSLRAFINKGDMLFVKTKLFSYLNNINYETGCLKRIEQEGSLESFDGVFVLAKRVEDYIFYLEKKGKLNEGLTKNEMEIIYDKFNLVFNKITQNYWDSEKELLKVKRGDSWMDTIDAWYPLDVEVQFLNFVSVLSILAASLNKKEEAGHFMDFEELLKEKIRASYLRNGNLYNEPFKDNLTSNVFLAYYYYPDLFLKQEWESIIDSSLKVLKTPWGGISSLSRNDKEFEPNYTGENDKSYHKGDSWFWINNITAIVLNDLNEQKYRGEIKGILLTSTKDILTMGTIGFGSEVSSASIQKAEGCMAQLWSSSTYIEMIDKLFERKA